MHPIAFLLLTLCASLFPTATSTRIARVAGAKAVALRVEHLEAPDGVDVRRPRFSWQLRLAAPSAVADRGLGQVMCDLQVSLDDETFARDSLVMNMTLRTGRTALIPFQPRSAAHELVSAQRYFWRVRSHLAVTMAGTHVREHVPIATTTSWSATARFTTGLYRRTDWDGGWLGGSVVPSAAGYVFGSGSLLRTEFELPAADPPRIALAFVAAAGLAKLTVNGHSPDNDRRALEPPLSQYERRMLYVTHDITGLLRWGSNTANNATNTSISNDCATTGGRMNTVGIALGRGFWSHWQFGEPAVMLQLIVRLRSGAIVRVSTAARNNTADIRGNSIGSSDARVARIWRTAPGGGPVREDDMFNGETFDGGLAHRLRRWDTPNFEAAKLEQYFSATARAPSHAPFTAAALSAALVPPTLKSVPQAPASTRRMSSDSAVLDCGQNGAGWSRVELWGSVPAGAIITLEHAELLNINGELYNQFPCPWPHVCVRQTDNYTTAGHEGETYEPSFVWHGYRYVHVRGCPMVGLKPARTRSHGDSGEHSQLPQSEAWGCDVRCVRVGTRLQAASTVAFSGTDAATVLNNIFAATVRTFRANTLGFQTSCPTREKTGWTGDTMATAPAALALFGDDAAAVLKRFLHNVRDNQALGYTLPAYNGSISDTLPHVQLQQSAGRWPSMNGSWPGDNGGFAPAFPMTVLRLWRALGDVELVKRHWNALETFMNTTEAMCGRVPAPMAFKNADGTFGPSGTKCGWYGDWSRPTHRFASTSEAGQFVSAFWLLKQRDAMQELATAIGRMDVAAAFSAAAADGREHFDAYFWNASLSTWAGGAAADADFIQTYSALSLALGCDGGKALGSLERRNRALAALVHDLAQRGGNHNVGLMGWTQLLPVLSHFMQPLMAQRVASSTDFPSIGYMLRHYGVGSTLWERWQPLDTSLPASVYNNTSYDHPMFGSVAAWLLHGLAGLDASHLGSTGILRVRPGVGIKLASSEDSANITTLHSDLHNIITGASAAQNTTAGHAAVTWQLVPGPKASSLSLSLNVTVPLGCLAELLLPVSADYVHITEAEGTLWQHGQFVSGVTGVLGATAREGGVLVTIASGAYTIFAAQAAAAQ